MKQLLYFSGFLIAISIIASCSSEPGLSTANVESAEIPNMVTEDVNMLISDSGVIKYKAISPVWYVYENDVKNKYWYFPKGIRLDQIDTCFSTVFSIVADTAYNYETKQLWHLIDNVQVHNVNGEYFRTNDLYWDLRKHEVYSDSFIHIERPDAIIEGYGFTSNDNFSKYELRETSGIFPFQEGVMNNPTDSTATPQNRDSLSQRHPISARKAAPGSDANAQAPHPDFNAPTPPTNPNVKRRKLLNPHSPQGEDLLTVPVERQPKRGNKR